MTQNVDGFCDNQWNKNNIQGLLNMATYLAKSSQHQPSMKHDGIPRCLSSLPLRILKTGTFDRHELDHTYIYIYNYIYIHWSIYIYTHTDSHTYIYMVPSPPPKIYNCLTSLFWDTAGTLATYDPEKAVEETNQSATRLIHWLPCDRGSDWVARDDVFSY